MKLLRIFRDSKKRILVKFEANHSYPSSVSELELSVQSGDSTVTWVSIPGLSYCGACGSLYDEHILEEDEFKPKCVFDATTFVIHPRAIKTQLYCNRETIRKIKKLRVGYVLELYV